MHMHGSGQFYSAEQFAGIADPVAYQTWAEEAMGTLRVTACPSGCELFDSARIGSFLRGECFHCPHPRHDSACGHCLCEGPGIMPQSDEQDEPVAAEPVAKEPKRRKAKIEAVED